MGDGGGGLVVQVPCWVLREQALVVGLGFLWGHAPLDRQTAAGWWAWLLPVGGGWWLVGGVWLLFENCTVDASIFCDC